MGEAPIADGLIDRGLWTSDGTPEGTTLLRDFFFADELTLIPWTTGGDRLFFSASDLVHGMELWTSDGSVEGTVMVKDIDPCQEDDYMDTPDFAAVATSAGRLLFGMNDGVHGEELWISDGTEGGTHLLKDINAAASS